MEQQKNIKKIFGDRVRELRGLRGISQEELGFKADDGKIQWEAPSNRSGGTYQHTHQKRRSWWREKALSLNIDVTKDQWISRTSKQIHPTGEKPCKKYGKVMRISHVYPKAALIVRF